MVSPDQLGTIAAWVAAGLGGIAIVVKAWRKAMRVVNDRRHRKRVLPKVEDWQRAVARLNGLLMQLQGQVAVLDRRLISNEAATEASAREVADLKELQRTHVLGALTEVRGRIDDLMLMLAAGRD